MGLAKAVFLLLSLRVLSVLVEGGDILSPILSPVLNGLCDAVDCGKGICRESENWTFGFECDCNAGWSQYHLGDHLRFLPCIVPNCSIHSSCSRGSPAPAPAPFPPPADNHSLFDPCTWSFCGGGECYRTSPFEHRCNCSKGYSNLLNVSSFPCYQECSIGADCVSLGISLSNSSSSPSSSPQSLGENSSSVAGGLHSSNGLSWLFMLVISLKIIMMT